MKPTLGQVFSFSLLALGAALGLLFLVVFRVSMETIIESSDRLRDGASHEIGERVTAFLAKAPEAVTQFQLMLNRGLVDPRDPLAVEAALLAPLLGNRDIGELTFTFGEKIGVEDNGELRLAPTPRGQWSVWRAADAQGGERFWSRHLRQEGGAFVADRRALERAEHFAAQPLERESAVNPDPTLHDTFTTPSRDDLYGRLIWSDPHWSQLDAALPEAERRVEVSVQQVITDAAGTFVGVLRVGLLKQQLDRVVRLKMTGEGIEDPHRIFICDDRGRLITQGGLNDRLEESDGDLRIAPEAVPALIASALTTSGWHTVSEKEPSVPGHFRFDGAEYLTTFRALPGSQDWIVGIVVPRSFYLGRLSAIRDRLLVFAFGLMVLLIAGGSLILRSVKRAQAQIVRESARMNTFEFSPSPTASPLRDVSAVLESLEQAKAAMRAMSKYAPIDLVRRLYREKSEPVLGGVDMEVSLMFTDIKGFTTFSEQLEPNELAAALGRYLEVMARIIQQECRGTIDKYIGDAIMTIWNAPEPVPDHARLACLAALRCHEAGRELARAAEWRGLPPFETRFGLHRDTALVGHFGAPDRMNYTAIGDAVNLASRLESLNKQYGTAIIASEHIVSASGGHFDFRLLDCVAVKGKSQAIQIYELLGEKKAAGERPPGVVAYERAFAAYVQSNFAAAAAILENNGGDPPSVGLLQRCRAYQDEPPPPDWRGIYVADSK